ncbi:MAG: ubiquinol-cytochrome C reductase, partial [Microbacterium sp.]|nr:ubiquinol-cytochrome C reductase [Microbacterium sp.]
MAHDDDTQALDRAYQPSPGLGVAVSDPAQNPGLPEHRQRMTDKDPKAEKAAVRTVYTLFYLSLAGSIWAVAAYMLFPIESGRLIDVRYNNLFIGLGIALALLAIGLGAIHWSKALMSDKEFVEYRHPTRGRDSTREASIKAFADANEESGFGRRVMIRNSMIAAVVASIIPGVTLFRGLAPFNTPENPEAGNPVALLEQTMWKKGVKLVRDPDGTPIRAADVTLGSAVHVIPEGLKELGH